MHEQERSPWSDPAYAPQPPAPAAQPFPGQPVPGQPAPGPPAGPGQPPGWPYGTPPPPPGVDIPKPWRRLVARLIDLPLATALAVTLVVALIQAVPKNENGDPPGLAIAGIFLIIFSTVYLYEALQLVLWGRTLGKRIMKLRVAPKAAPTAPLSPFRGLGRAAAYPMLFMVLGVLPLISFVNLFNSLWLLWDRPLRQCLHDKIANTLVVADPAGPRRAFMIPAVLATVVILAAGGIGVAVAAPGGTRAADPGRGSAAGTPPVTLPPTPPPTQVPGLGGVEPDPAMTTPSGPELTTIDDACALFPKEALGRLAPGATGRPGRETESWLCAWKSSRDTGTGSRTRVTREISARITLKKATGTRTATYLAARDIARDRRYAQHPEESLTGGGLGQKGPVRYRDLPGLGDEAFVTYRVQELVGETGIGKVTVRVRNAVVEITFRGGSNGLDEFGDEVFAGQRAMPEAEARRGAEELARAATTAILACTTCTG
ncbi:RDD family protein [Spirillospora sp. NPDC047279]|uniref:RDD family protein n=1 Tax=Spirillospora sp. NPDC047279 TaxID=3155478 RepID=UPI0033DFE95B